MTTHTEAAPILLTGVSGQVGSALLPRLQRLYPVVAPVRAELDLRNGVAVREAVRTLRPRWIVNPGAYTAVDRAESETAAAWAVNADAPGVLGEEARAQGVPVIHLSTDYVFPGSGTTPWKETDGTAPLNAYGRSKLAGEEALAASGAAHVTLRTSWVYAATGQNFLRTMLRLGREREELRIVGDQHGTPTAADDLAALIVALLRRFEAEAEAGATTGSAERAAALEGAVRREGGVLHAAGSGATTTWFGFAEAIFAALRAQQPEARVPRLTAIQSAEYATPAVRPHNSRLDCTRLEHQFGYRMPEWQSSLRRIVGDVLALDKAAERGA